MEAVIVRNGSTATATAADGTTRNVGDGDEEAQQQTITATTTITLEILQKQVLENKNKIEQDMQNANNSIELLQHEIRNLQDKMLVVCEEEAKVVDSTKAQITSRSRSLMTGNILEETKGQRDEGGETEEGISTATEQEEAESLLLHQRKLQSHAARLSILERHVLLPTTTQQANPTSQEPPETYTDRRFSALEGQVDDNEVNNNGENKNDDVLPEDTFTLMMLSPLRSQAWLLGIFTLAFQSVLSVMIAANQLQESIESSAFNIPFKVDPVVRAGQLFAIVYFLATQDDITSSIRFLVMFWKSSNWDRTFSGQNGHSSWFTNILLPNLLRFLQGVIVMFISFVIIVQSENIIDLLKDFTALMVLSETDNIFFGLAASGYFGRKLQRNAMIARDVEIKYEACSSGDSETDENNNNATARAVHSSSGGFFVRPFILSCIGMVMIGSWIYIVLKQVNGEFFNERYKKCSDIVPNAFELATKHFGDGICYGGPLNTFECKFEDGDCINFNTAYPLCKGINRTDAEDKVGDGECDAEFMDADCDYDGGDCCPYEIINDASFGDGQCNGGISSTARCGYDNGDCNPLRIAHPDCPFDDLSNMTGANDVILGDGICDGNAYVVKECGFEYGDCHQGQVGQTIFNDDGVRSFDSLYFSKVLSLDASTLALGLYATDEDGRFYYSVPGFVKVWRFSMDKKLWLRLGDTIQSRSGLRFDYFGRRMSMSENGNHLAISSTSGLNVFEVNDLSGNEEWIQVGQTLKSAYFISIGIISSDGSRAALIFDSKEIRIYNLETIPDGQTWMHDDDLDVIKVDEINQVYNVELRFAPSDDSTLLFSDFDRDFVKIFRQSNPDVAWRQIGQDIGTASSSSSMAIASNGNRIGVHKHSNDTSSGSSNSGQDEVQVLDYDGTEWLPVGSPIVSSSLNDGQEFGYGIEMSADGNLLLVGVNHPDCRDFSNLFHFDNCIKSSGSLFELYTYHPENNQFITSPLRKNVKDAKEVSDGSILHGLHFSLGNGDNGSTLLSVSNYNLVDEVVFVDVIDLDELYYTKCAVDNPHWIGDGGCDDRPPYNTEACGFDGGDCERNPVDGYPDCFVNSPDWIDDGYCYDYPPYNTEACGFDGGDCVPKPVDGYDNCFVHRPDDIGNGRCDDHDGPYNTEACGFDGGDCDLYNGLTDCHVNNPYWIGDGYYCDDRPPYNTAECGFDGGDCVPMSVDGYPDCFVDTPDYIGDGVCYDHPPYNTAECKFDGGDCL